MVRKIILAIMLSVAIFPGLATNRALLIGIGKYDRMATDTPETGIQRHHDVDRQSGD